MGSGVAEVAWVESVVVIVVDDALVGESVETVAEDSWACGGRTPTP